jgi:hypothetical protein
MGYLEDVLGEVVVIDGIQKCDWISCSALAGVGLQQ